VPNLNVYRIPLERPAAVLDRLEAHLSDVERARMARFRYPDDRRRYLAAHGILRETLAELTGIPPARLRFREGPHGKPYLDPPRLGLLDFNFSLSHSGELAMIAVSAGREVGMDVEKVRPEVDAVAIADRFFAPEEACTLAGLPATQRKRSFFELWTRKEALSKARGMALAPALREPEHLGGEWTVEPVDAGEGYAAAVAYGVSLDAPLCREKSNLRPTIILTIR
jgi:4'-phosphopantetheinyl transferase